jgi:predicted GIY-YIG superfamily endonuclease
MSPEQIGLLGRAIKMIQDGPNCREGWDTFVADYNGYEPADVDEVRVRPVHPEVKAQRGWVYVLSSEWGVEYVGQTRRPLIERLRQHYREDSPLWRRQMEVRRHVFMVEAWAVDDLERLEAIEWAFIHLLEPPLNRSVGRVA